MSLLTNLFRDNFSNFHSSLDNDEYYNQDIHTIDNNTNIDTNDNEPDIDVILKQNRHLRVLLTSVENFVFNNNYYSVNIMANHTLRELSTIFGLSSLEEFNFSNVLIVAENENIIRNFIENNINNNNNIINNSNNEHNIRLYNQNQVLSEQLIILKSFLDEFVYNSNNINNYLSSYSLSQIISSLGLNLINGNNLPDCQLSPNNKYRVLSALYHQQRMNDYENNHSNLSLMLDELLEVLLERENNIFPNLNNNYQDSNEDRMIPKCCICLENNCSVVMIPCGHVCSCHRCCTSIVSCPICRQEITNHQTIYF